MSAGHPMCAGDLMVSRLGGAAELERSWRHEGLSVVSMSSGEWPWRYARTLASAWPYTHVGSLPVGSLPRAELAGFWWTPA